MALFNSVGVGDIEGVRAHLQHSTKREKELALVESASKGVTEIVQLFLDHGVDPYVGESDPYTRP